MEIAQALKNAAHRRSTPKIFLELAFGSAPTSTEDNLEYFKTLIVHCSSHHFFLILLVY